jgi:hypothetical protein
LAASSLGPVLSATVATGTFDHSIAAYREHLSLAPAGEARLGRGQAEAWGCPELAGARMAWLSNQLGEPWLRMLEIPGQAALDPFRHRGWFSLEISVSDVDRLAPKLDASPFEVLGPPANLEVSDAIRAMQLRGPAGELLYLTEIKAEVPPFELPFPRCPVDRLFIPVMLTSDRDATLAVYESLAGRAGLSFDTRITVINKGRGWPLATRHPVATLQLRGNTLIEIDQIDGLTARPLAGGLPPGIAMVSFEVPALPSDHEHYLIEDGPFAGRPAARLVGAAGEWIELIANPNHLSEPEELP